MALKQQTPQVEEGSLSDENSEVEIDLSGTPCDGPTQQTASSLSPSSEKQDKNDQSPQSHEELLATASQLVTSLTGQEVKKRKRIPYSLVEVSKGNRCPTPGCTGIGHVTGMYAMHYAVSGCPKAHGKTPEECKVRNSYIPHLASSFYHRLVAKNSINLRFFQHLYQTVPLYYLSGRLLVYKHHGASLFLPHPVHLYHLHNTIESASYMYVVSRTCTNKMTCCIYRVYCTYPKYQTTVTDQNQD